jgi:cell division protein FtsQ
VSVSERLKSIARYFPLAAKIVLAIATGVLMFAGYRAAVSASFFQVRSVDLRGAARASTDQIQTAVRREAGQNGVWQADLPAIVKQVERLPWVRTAVVSRLLPDVIRVRISERVPRAVVRTSAGRFVWVDEDAVMLSEMSPTDQIPAFFLRGWNEESTVDARMENRERVQKYLEVSRQWDAAGLSGRVSEVNLVDVRDVRAQLAGNDSQIEVRLGSRDLDIRLKKALEVLDEQRQTARGPFISYIDLSQGKRAIVGFTSGRQIAGDSAGSTADTNSARGDRTQRRATEPVSNRTDDRAKGNNAAKRAEREKKRTRSGAD